MVRAWVTGVVSLATGLALSGCGDRNWYAIVYPNGGSRANAEVIGIYKGLDECREGIRQQFVERRLNGAGGRPIVWECVTQCVDAADLTKLDCKRWERGNV